ncbi:MAG: hypothetical protein QG673_1531 [Pseudomonadota bacterium]|nr:hypothetical protein [Pseudomonadota bacterium]
MSTRLYHHGMGLKIPRATSGNANRNLLAALKRISHIDTKLI